LQVSELKQLNRLISDQDVFGLHTIRVPVKRYGVVEELIQAEMEEAQTNMKLGSSILCVISSAKEVMFSWILITFLFISRIAQKLLNQFWQNLVERCHIGHEKNH